MIYEAFLCQQAHHEGLTLIFTRFFCSPFLEALVSSSLNLSIVCKVESCFSSNRASILRLNSRSFSVFCGCCYYGSFVTLLYQSA
ncbi:hypothetical protein Plhal304r1_c076g0163271 [Plasmopara halstedii]